MQILTGENAVFYCSTDGFADALLGCYVSQLFH